MPRQYDTLTEECDGYNVDPNITMRHGTELDGRKSYREFCDRGARLEIAAILASENLPLIDGVGSN